VERAPPDAGQRQAPRAGRGLDLLGLLQEPERRRGKPSGFNPACRRIRRKVTGRAKADGPRQAAGRL